MALATNQYTILDMNDVTIATAAPSGAALVVDALWFDIQSIPPALKRYDGSQWVSANISPEEYGYLYSTYNGTTNYRTNGAPTNEPSPIGLTVKDNVNGTIDVTLTWDRYIQGVRQADTIIVIMKNGPPPLGAPTDNDTIAFEAVNTDGPASHVFQGINPSDNYSFGIAASRRTENGAEITAVVSVDGISATFVRNSQTYCIDGTPLASGVARFENIGGPSATFSRGTYSWNNSGIYSDINIPRYDNSRISGESSILIEEATTNLFSTGIATAVASGGFGSSFVTLTNDNTKSWKGDWSLKSVASSSGSAVGPYCSASITAGSIYTASVYVLNGNATKQIRVGIEWHSATGTISTSWSNLYTPSMNTWTRLSVTGTAPTGAITATVTTYASAAVVGDIFWYDGFQIERKSSATSWTKNNRSIDIVSAPGSKLKWDACSMSGWFWTDVAAPEANRFLFSHGNSNGKNLIGVRQTWDMSGRLVAICGNNSATRTDLSSTATLLVNEWNHVVLTWTTAKLELYLNGVRIGYVDSPSLPQFNERNLYIGSLYGNQGLFSGRVSDFRVYNRGLSSTEVSGMYIETYPQIDRNTYRLSFNNTLEADKRYGYAVHLEEGTTNTLTSQAARMISGWTKTEASADIGKTTITANANGEEKLIFTNSSSGNLTSWADMRVSLSGVSAYQGQTWTLSFSEIEISNLTTGTVSLYMEDYDGTTYRSTTGPLAANGLFLNQSITRVWTTPASGSLQAAWVGIRLSGVNSGTTITVKRAQFEQKDHCSTWVDGTRNADIATISASGCINNSNDFTIHAWVNPLAANSSLNGTSANIVSNWQSWNPSGQKGFVLRASSNGGWYPGIFLCDGVNYASLTHTTKMKANTWSHIAGVFKAGQTLKVYLNGVPVAMSSNIPTQCVLEDDILKIGNSAINPPGWLNGLLDDLCFEKRALTDQEILDVYNLNDHTYRRSSTKVLLPLDNDFSQIDMQDLGNGSPNYTGNIGGGSTPTPTGLILSSNGFLKSVKQNVADTAAGIWLGRASDGTVSFNFGDASNYLKWDSTSALLTMAGKLNLVAGSTGFNNLDAPANVKTLTGAESIDNSLVQVGGRNLLFNSVFASDSSNWTSSGNHTGSVRDISSQYNSFNSLKIVSTGNGASGNLVQQVLVNSPIISGQSYAISFMAKGNVGGETLHCELLGGTGAFNSALTTSWKKFTGIVTGSSTSTFYMWLTAAGTCWVTNIKLEAGNKVTDWTPAVEDVNASLYIGASSAALNVPADGELFSFNQNVTGSRGTAPNGGSGNYYTRRYGEGLFGDCIAIEDSSTNLYKYSCDFSNAIWSKNGAVVTAASSSGINGPDGTAVCLATNTPSASSLINQQVPMVSGTSYSQSLYVKPMTTLAYAAFEYYCGGSFYSCKFDLNANTVTSTLGSGLITPCSNGWFRLTHVFAAPASGYTTGTFIGAYGSTTSTCKLALWGAQLETKSFATSHISTTSASATRLNGKLVYKGLEKDINFGKFSFLAWMRFLGPIGVHRRIWGCWDTQFALFSIHNNNQIRYSYWNTTQQDDFSTFTITDTNWHLIGLSVDAANGAITYFKDGQANVKSGLTIGYTNTPFAFTFGDLTANTTSNPFNGLVDNMIIYKNSVINSETVKSIYNAQKPFYDLAYQIKVPSVSGVTVSFS